MILWIIGLFVVLTFVSWLLIKNGILRWLCGIVTTLILGTLIVGLAANMHSHYGMKKVSETTSTEVYSILPAQYPVKGVAVKEISKNNYVLIYKDKTSDAKPSAHFIPDKKHIVEAVKQRADFTKTNDTKAYVKTTTVSWEYKNKFMKKLFDVGHENNENLVSKKHILEVPNNWQVIAK